MSEAKEAKKTIDKIINKSRVHLYKPIQIAEILHRDRSEGDIDLKDLESYRSVSKKWRDQITIDLVGRISTSSAKFQDNLFDANAMPPEKLVKLGKINRDGKGIVETYIYNCFKKRLSMVTEAREYITAHDRKSFKLREFLNLFQSSPGLKRSIDKAFEIVIFALFASLVRYLEARVTVSFNNPDRELLRDFEEFTKLVLGIDASGKPKVAEAKIYRVGVTNAADRGLDMVSNFGPIIQVKHLSLSYKVAEDIVESFPLEQILIVCLEAEKETLKRIFSQMGWKDRIQGIITLDDLDKWYVIALSDKYKSRMGATLLTDLDREFVNEFPSTDKLDEFLNRRNYKESQLTDVWTELV